MLRDVHWDLCIVDEAHKMAAYRYGMKVNKTQRYELGEFLRDHTDHFLFLTATPFILHPFTSERSERWSWHDRITVDPEDLLVGKPVIKGTRISVEFLVELLANGWTHEQILKNYPHLTAEDILAAWPTPPRQ